MAYTPKYISEADVPVQIPDDYSSAEKQDAIEIAESMIELELSDGGSLNTVSVAHKAAIKQRATCELAKGAEDNDDVALGDLDDGGQTKFNYAHEAFCKTYGIIVDKIQAHIDTDSQGVFVYNTQKSEKRDEWEDLLEEIDVDLSEDFAR